MTAGSVWSVSYYSQDSAENHSMSKMKAAEASLYKPVCNQFFPVQLFFRTVIKSLSSSTGIRYIDAYDGYADESGYELSLV